MLNYWVSGVHEFSEDENSGKIRKVGEEWHEYGDLSTKIDIFESRTKSWFLNHVKYLAELEKNPTNGDHTTPGDYSAIVLACSQLEGFQKYRDGKKEDGNGKYYFKKALKEIFFVKSDQQAEKKDEDEEDEQVLKFLYDSLRSGSFHSGFPDGKIYLDRDLSSPISIKRKSDDKKIDRVIVNPVRFVDKLLEYFDEYVSDLKNKDNSDLREKFEIRWDCLWAKS